MWLGGWRGNVGVLSVATDREDENGCMKMPERYSGWLFDGDCRFCSFFFVYGRRHRWWVWCTYVGGVYSGFPRCLWYKQSLPDRDPERDDALLGVRRGFAGVPMVVVI